MPRTLVLPETFSIAKQHYYDFAPVLDWFDWSIRDDSDVLIDFRECRSANFQTLALLVLYVWRLRKQGCTIRFEHSQELQSASAMWNTMGARGWSQVLSGKSENFEGSEFKPLIAVRNNEDANAALRHLEEFTAGFDAEYGRILRQVVSELLRNAQEHGKASLGEPVLVQISQYEKREELCIVVADLGIGIKNHLAPRYPGLDGDEEYLHKAIEPNVSGTFFSNDPYSQPNNAGVGLYASSDIMKQVKGDLYLASGQGVLHVSGLDTTSRTLQSKWPGTVALVNLQLRRHPPAVGLAEIMSKSLEAARKTNGGKDQSTYYVGIYNYFGTSPADKEAAIKYRDKHLMDAAKSGKVILLDFDRVDGAVPHSFLNALLKGPIRAIAEDNRNPFKFIKRANEDPAVRAIIDYILDTNT
jgi:anti-sigma regulatory factor (Ser/Thr protein kinase)